MLVPDHAALLHCLDLVLLDAVRTFGAQVFRSGGEHSGGPQSGLDLTLGLSLVGQAEECAGPVTIRALLRECHGEMKKTCRSGHAHLHPGCGFSAVKNTFFTHDHVGTKLN